MTTKRTFTLDFELKNAAFATREDSEAECERIMLIVANKVSSGDECGIIRDINGNTVGDWTVDLDPEEKE